VTAGNTGPPEWVLLNKLADWIACRCSLDKSEVERRLPTAMMEVWSDPTNFRLHAQHQLANITNWLPLEVSRSAGTAIVQVRHLLAHGDGDENGYGFYVLARMLGLDVRYERDLLAQHGKKYWLDVDGHAVLTAVLRQAPSRFLRRQTAASEATPVEASAGEDGGAGGQWGDLPPLTAVTPHPRRNYAGPDAPLVAEMHRRLTRKRRPAKNATDAARQVVKVAQGEGTEGSTVKRLVARYYLIHPQRTADLKKPDTRA
jgi:hypothetical protein